MLAVLAVALSGAVDVGFRRRDGRFVLAVFSFAGRSIHDDDNDDADGDDDALKLARSSLSKSISKSTLSTLRAVECTDAEDDGADEADDDDGDDDGDDDVEDADPADGDDDDDARRRPFAAGRDWMAARTGIDESTD